MILNHINLTVPDVLTTRSFLEKYFDLSCKAERGSGFAVLMNDQGFVLTLMRGKEISYPKTFHIGFSQENEERVNQIYQQLKHDGFDVTSPEYAHGYTFYVKSPGGFTIEVMC
jgi:catechol-2,3-dioxygenase